MYRHTWGCVAHGFWESCLPYSSLAAAPPPERPASSIPCMYFLAGDSGKIQPLLACVSSSGNGAGKPCLAALLRGPRA